MKIHKCLRFSRIQYQIGYIELLFPIDNLCDAVETAKRFLTKEKIDRQMSGQSTTPFMTLTEKKRKTVTFDARDALEKTSENMERMMALMDKMYYKIGSKRSAL